MLVKLANGESIDHSMVYRIQAVHGGGHGTRPRVVILNYNNEEVVSYPMESYKAACAERDIMHDVVNEQRGKQIRVLA